MAISVGSVDSLQAKRRKRNERGVDRSPQQELPMRDRSLVLAEGFHAMPTFVIERKVPGAAKLSADELRQISAKSNEVAAGLGVPYKWITSYVAGDMIYCVHEAPSAEIVLRHAREGGFPANKVTEVAAFIDPSTADSKS
jgi:hypothetical protein